MYEYISLFSGAGGLDIGLERAGFVNRLCVENNSHCIETLTLNRPQWVLSKPGDVSELSSLKITRQSGLRKRNVGMIAGGAPCQPFSKASYWVDGDSKRLNDSRAATIRSYIRVVDDLLPNVILFENVKGFIYKNKDEGHKYILNSLERINRENNVNYKPTSFVINCADYGVPQQRERLFIIAHRDGKQFELPAPSYGKELSGEKRWFSAWDAIGDLDIVPWSSKLDLIGKWAKLLPSIPEGANYLWHTSQGGGAEIFGYRTRFWNFLLKLAKDNPSWTISANPGPSTGPFHWRNRRLSIQELCRLQTIPENWKITGNYRDAHTQVGNAIPSLIGEMLGNEIKKQFYDVVDIEGLTLLPIRNTSKHKKERRKPLAKQFKDHVRSFDSHPGVGLGPGALSRN